MRVLVVEDDPDLGPQIRSSLLKAGYEVDLAADGEQGHLLGETSDFDAVVLDLGLPVIGGLDVLRKWREAGKIMPVLILSARDLWSDKVEGIDTGADDYLSKPFHMAELIARLRALIKRAGRAATPVMQVGPITFDTRTSTVTRQGQVLDLTSFEGRLLRLLMSRAGDTVTRSELIEHLYAQDFARDSNTIEVFIRRLRTKLGSHWIETVKGKGYRMPGIDRLTKTKS